MSDPAPASRSAFRGVVSVWAVSLIAAIAIGFLAAEDARVGWLLIAFGAMVLLAFAVQLAHGEARGFIVRVAGSLMGALVIMGLVSAVFGLAALAATF